MKYFWKAPNKILFAYYLKPTPQCTECCCLFLCGWFWWLRYTSHKYILLIMYTFYYKN